LFFPLPLLSQALGRREMAIAGALLLLERRRKGVAHHHLQLTVVMPLLPARKGSVTLSEFFEE
jgi:hypothetical protein